MRTSNLSEYDLYLFHEGTNYHAYEMYGAHFIERDGKKGVRFALWAPHAKSVSVVGDFNNWDARVNCMIRLSDGETWETFIEGLKQGDLYKYAILPQNGKAHILKDDPYGFWAEKSPNTASKLYNLEDYDWQDNEWLERKKRQSSYSHPMLIYEVHAGSWQRTANNDYLSYRELADRLIAYVKEMNYTHIEFLPLTEHEQDKTWGYQTTGYYAVTSRYGEPNDFRYLVETAHKNNIGVIMDWVPGHFSKAEQGLRSFDGVNLYESDKPTRSENRDWDTINFDYGRTEVHSFLISNALFWFEEFHIDGLRIDGVANMLYLKREWTPNRYSDTCNPEAVEFLKKLNETVFKYHPQALMVAEETTAWPQISKPVYMGGMGFNYKWNMGWKKDILEYLSLEPIYRKWNQDKITMSMMNAFAENFILALSHKEVVHGKGSLLEKMRGDYWEKFAGLRGFYGYWMAHSGKKLVFMGGEFGQLNEWNEAASLDWHLVSEYDLHKKLQKYTQDLNKIYVENKALWEVDFERNGMKWLESREQSIITFERKGAKEYLIVISNFSEESYERYKMEVPEEGQYEEVLNTDRKEYGGRGVINKRMETEEHKLTMRIGPLATIYLKRAELTPRTRENRRELLK